MVVLSIKRKMLRINDLETKLKKDGFIIGDIQGSSMSPFLKEKRNKVVISKINRDLRLYDVVLYKINDHYILHRIIGFEDNICLIRGDNCVAIEKVDRTSIVGILIAYYSRNEYIELNEDINIKWYKKSNSTLLYRRIRNKLIRTVGE